MNPNDNANENAELGRAVFKRMPRRFVAGGI